VRANILAADAVQKTRLVHYEQRLGMGTAQDQVLAAFAKLFIKVLQCIQAGGIYGEHLPHAQDENIRLLP